MAYYGKTLESARILAYIRRYGVREHEVMKQCRLETLKARPEDYDMMIMPEEATFLSFFVEVAGYKRGLELGVYTGYSSLALSMAMPDDGELVCCELSQEFVDIASSYWEKAGVKEKITPYVGDGVGTLNTLLENGEESSFDFAYIDADKEQYDSYYESSLKLVRKGGVIILDNMLWDGKVLDKTDETEATLAIKKLNEKIHADDRVEVSLTTIGDGTTFARKI